MKLKDLNPNLVIVAALALGGVIVYYRTKSAILENIDLVNPASHENLVYRAATAAGNAIIGDGQDIPWGVRLYEFWHRDEV